MARIIDPQEWLDSDVVGLARSLLGKVLVRTTDAGRDARVIVEVEAYNGEPDLACHASKGRTARTDVLYRTGGIWYVYLCYGIHEMLNLVVGREGVPKAILVRGVEGAVGPGRLTKRMSIDRSLNGKPAAPETGLHLEDHGIVVRRRDIIAGPRVGIDYAGPLWAAKPWRFQWMADTLERQRN